VTAAALGREPVNCFGIGGRGTRAAHFSASSCRGPASRPFAASSNRLAMTAGIGTHEQAGRRLHQTEHRRVQLVEEGLIGVPRPLRDPRLETGAPEIAASFDC
jgi:hypothetical protein